LNQVVSPVQANPTYRDNAPYGGRDTRTRFWRSPGRPAARFSLSRTTTPAASVASCPRPRPRQAGHRVVNRRLHNRERESNARKDHAQCARWTGSGVLLLKSVFQFTLACLTCNAFRYQNLDGSSFPAGGSKPAPERPRRLERPSGRRSRHPATVSHTRPRLGQLLLSDPKPREKHDSFGASKSRPRTAQFYDFA
jgi:hypothetical protein